MTRLQFRLATCTFVMFVLTGIGTAAYGQVSPAPAAQTGNDPFGFAVRPFTAPGALPRDAIDYDLQPGETVHDRVSVINVTGVAKQFYIYAQDAYNAPVGGGFALNLRQDPVTDSAAWISIPVSQQTVPAHTAAIIPVTISVPLDAQPGDHSAGIIAEEIIPPSSLSSGQGVVKVPRVATRVYLRVTGPLHPALQVQRLVVKHHDPLIPFVTGSGTVTVTCTIKNVGNVRVQLNKVSVDATDVFGRALKHVAVVRGAPGSSILPDQLLPNNTAAFTVQWHGLPPLDIVTARVEVFGQDELLSTPVSAVASRQFWILPWLLIAVIAVILATVVWRLRRRRRAGGGRLRRKPPTTPSTLDSSEPPDREDLGVPG